MRSSRCLACHGRGCSDCEGTGRALCGVVPDWQPPTEYCDHRRPCPTHDTPTGYPASRRPHIAGVTLGPRTDRSTP